MVLPLEGVSRGAVILRFYRWRDALPAEGLQLCLPSLGLATGTWGSRCRCVQQQPAGHLLGGPWRWCSGDRCGGLACMGGWLAWGRLLLQQVLVASPTTQAWGRALVQVSVQEIVEDNFKHNFEIMTFELSNSHHPETTGY